MPRWTLYILECSDGSLYTGITTGLANRIKCHNEGKASKYTRTRLPVKLAYKKIAGSESAARKEEARIKGLSRIEKLQLL
ncbi:MAG: GIY-YIG nuclease family protein [Candidatus Omnitrophota bacterium]